MALNPCVAEILCALSAPVLGALKALIQTQVAEAQITITALSAQINVVNVALLPIEIARDLASDVLERVRSAATLVPLDLIAGCADLGDVNLNLNKTLDQATAEFEFALDEATRLLSFRDELQAQIDSLNLIITQFNDVLLTIEGCTP